MSILHTEMKRERRSQEGWLSEDLRRKEDPAGIEANLEAISSKARTISEEEIIIFELKS